MSDDRWAYHFINGSFYSSDAQASIKRGTFALRAWLEIHGITFPLPNVAIVAPVLLVSLRVSISCIEMQEGTLMADAVCHTVSTLKNEQLSISNVVVRKKQKISCSSKNIPTEGLLLRAPRPLMRTAGVTSFS
jgi:hypothetical protein